MASSPILLIEWLEGLGAHEADAALRLRLLQRLRTGAVTVEVVDGAEPVAAGSAAVRERVLGLRPRELWIAGSHAAWSSVRAALPDAPRLLWWPTLVPGSGREPCELPPHPSLPLEIGAVAGTVAGHAAFELAPVRAGREHSPVPLWDGAFVLVPGPLSGPEGRRLLGAFAIAAAEAPEIELVVLADADPDSLSAAWALGLGPRVHFAGVAPREAEHTWLATASAILLPTQQAVSAGLVVRSLASGTPLVLDPSMPGAAAIAAWLGAASGGEAPSAEHALAAALARAPAARAACARGRTRAAAHEPDALAARVSLAHGEPGSRRAA